MLHALRSGAGVIAARGARARRADPDAVHRVRVATRRLRAALRLAARATDTDVRRLRRELRSLGRALGDVREADVIRALLRREARRYFWPPAAVARVDAVCAADRDAALSRLRAELKGLEPHALARRVRSVATVLARRQTGSAAARGLATEIRRRTRRLIGALDRAGTVYGTDSLHQVRLAAKKLRYTLEIGLAADAAAGARALKRLQQRLGDIHDLQTLQRTIRGVRIAPGVQSSLTDALDGMDRDLELDCRQRHAVVLRSRKALDRRLAEIARTSARDLLPERAARVIHMSQGGLQRKAAG